ncbi:hypothetical protein XbrCFBP1976_11160 [Xanthomonas bromi]|uniref:Uncharacterized protein n=1 Tax=Xanthomonas bromi TaxID=56449 RepID=A0ABX5BQ65_9XANT|nr:hypothetical protein XbrCFBP1976_11160 [Xanthomonas bromi]
MSRLRDLHCAKGRRAACSTDVCLHVLPSVSAFVLRLRGRALRVVSVGDARLPAAGRQEH